MPSLIKKIFLRFKAKPNKKRLLIVNLMGFVLVAGGLLTWGLTRYSADENTTLPPIFAITWGSPTDSMTHQTNLISFYSTRMSNWKVGDVIKVNDMRYYGGHTYQALQAHTTSSATEPGVGVDWTTNWSQSTVGIYQKYDGSPSLIYPIDTTIKQLKAKPVGKRAIIIQGLDGDYYSHPDDRCRDASGTLDAFSKSPKGMGVLGNDGKPSGYPCPFMGEGSDHWRIDAKKFTDALVAKLVEVGASVDFVIFDMESQISVWNLNGAWKKAIMEDPRWPAFKTQLDELVRVRRRYPEGSTNPKAQFPVDIEKMTFGDWVGDITNSAWFDWGALEEKNAADSLNVIFNGFKLKWPNIKGSEYAFSGWKVNDGNVGSNGHHTYSLGIVGTAASTISYGGLWQARTQTAGDDDWHTLLWEQNQVRGSVRAGYAIQPWVGFASFAYQTNWVTDYTSPYPHTPNPYWQENIRHHILLGADPLLNFAPNSTLQIKKVDLETNTVEVYGGGSDVCRWNSHIDIGGSTGNNGHYTKKSCVDTDSTHPNTRFVLNQPLKSTVADGKFITASSDEINQQTEDLLVELDAQIGTDGPRETVQSEMLGYLGNAFATGLRHGNQVTYRVSYNRSDWSNPQTMNVLKNGAQIGTLMIPAGRLGAYYTTNYNVADKYTFASVSPDPLLVNLLPNNDFNSASWLCDGVACTTAKIGPNSLDVTDPVGNNQAWKINLAYKRLTPATPITVKPNTTYIISADTKCYNTVTPPPNSISCGGYIGFVNSNGDSKGTWTNILAAKGWNKSSFAYTTTSNETTITPYLGLSQAYIYDLKLTEEPPPAPYIRCDGGDDTVSIPELKLARTFTYKNKMIISGTKHAKVKKVLINNKQAQVDDVANTWTIENDLNVGSNTFTISGQDQSGNVSSSITRTITRRKIGDFNNDTKIDGSDFTLLLFNWGSVVANNFADFNEDGKVDGSDFTIMLYWWGK